MRTVTIYMLDSTGLVLSKESRIKIINEFLVKECLKRSQLEVRSGVNYNSCETLYNSIKALNGEPWEVILTTGQSTGAVQVSKEIKDEFFRRIQVPETADQLTGSVLSELM